ncbi:uncharacterized protein TNCT_195641 [Trichonephila clavata]|uniref:Uncharacterized protein n=1 Tax=Trichonephila clavata TaxID=2740835 RepID=A0A8X6HSL3_TRICU|nr:uncharacterized protein TNCT_195641 [Trichonephila clavata]
MENRRFTVTELSSHFPQISRSLLHEIVTKHLLFKKLCVRWVPKNLTPEQKIQRLGAALTFLQRYHDDGDEFLDRILMGDETWISQESSERILLIAFTHPTVEAKPFCIRKEDTNANVPLSVQ